LNAADFSARPEDSAAVVRHRVCIIPGDGIGQEVVPETVRVLKALLPGIDLVPSDAGFGCFQRRGSAVPAETLDAVASSEATLFGATASPLSPVQGYRSAIVTLRKHFRLYGCIRHARSLPLPGARPGIDLLVVRENTEGLYIGKESSYGDYAEAVRLVSAPASRRVAELAHSLAKQAGRSRITIVHKANILPQTCGLFRDTARSAIEARGGLVVDEMLVDTAAMRLAVAPEQFDVILTTNLFGDILSDIAAGVTGGLGVAASANVGEAGPAVFEPVHGSAPDIVGQGIANPVACLRAAVLLLHHIGEHMAAGALEQAIDSTLAGSVRSPDLGGKATTTQVVDEVLRKLEARTAAGGTAE
jgi:homoisocitrate dehydrogenase